MKYIVNIDGWYVPGFPHGGMAKGSIIDTNALNEKARARVIGAFESGETGRCPKEGNKLVPVLLRKTEEADIIENTLNQLKEFVGNDATVDQDKIDEFKAQLRGEAPPKKKAKEKVVEDDDDEDEDDEIEEENLEQDEDDDEEEPAPKPKKKKIKIENKKKKKKKNVD